MKAVLIATTILLLAAYSPAAEKSGPLPVPAGCVVVENTQAEKTVTLSAADLAKLPHVEVVLGPEFAAVADPEADKRRRKYSGVPLSDLLRCAGAEWGGDCSPLLAHYVLVEAADGYRALFSIPEIDPEQRHKMVILADRCDGKPLSSDDGPLKTVEEGAKQHGRCVKQVKAISLLAAPRHEPRVPNQPAKR